MPKVLFGMTFNESFNRLSSLCQSPGIETVPWKNNQNKEIVHHLPEPQNLDRNLALEFVSFS